jgi:hypothetical protein
MLSFLLLLPILILFDPGFWVMVAGWLSQEDEKNKELLGWKLTGL